jgi:hypothetical protein
MMALTLVVVRVYFTEIAKIYEEPPENAKKDYITACKKTKSNMLHIITCLYEIVMEYLKSNVPQQ